MADYTDTFTGTNGTDLATYNSTWVLIGGDGVGYYGINGNAAQTLFSGTNPDNTYRYNNTAGQDQYSEGIVDNLGGSLDSRNVLIVRADTGTSSSNHYKLVIEESSTGNGGTKNFLLYKTTTGTPAQIGSTFTAAVSNGDTIRLEATGGATTTLATKVNGSQIDSRTDSSSPFTSGQVGIGGAKTGGIRWASWGGGDISGGGGGSTYASLLGGLTQSILTQGRLVQ